MRNCVKCKLSLPQTDFCRQRDKACTICENLRKKKWKKNNADKQLFYQKQCKYKRRTNPPGKYTKLVLEEKMRYWGNKCYICNSPDNITADHVKPLSKGGSNWISNIRSCCSKCNSIKSNKWKGNGVAQKLEKITSYVHQKLKIKKTIASIRGPKTLFLLKHVGQSHSLGHSQIHLPRPNPSPRHKNRPTSNGRRRLARRSPKKRSSSVEILSRS